MKKIIISLVLWLLCVAGISYGQSPGGVAANERLWLKANSGVTTLAGLVTAWADQSGGSNNATGTGIKPTVTAPAINSYPAITYAGTGGLQGSFGTAVTASNVSAFVVANVSAATGSPSGIFSIAASGTVDSAAAGNAVLFESNTAAIATVRSGAVQGKYASANALGQYHICSSLFSPTQDLFYTEGAAGTASSFTAPALNDDLYTIGARYAAAAGSYLTGKIAEVILYDRQVSATERNQIESYLAIKYGITLSQATAQNYVSSAGTVVWSGTANAGYKNNIFGVAIDNGSALSQTGSVSLNTSLLTISGAVGLSTGSFLMVSDNAGGTALTTSTTLPNAINARLGTVWRASQTGSRATANFIYNNSTTAFGYYAPIASAMTPYMLIDSDANGVYETYIAATSKSGSNITFMKRYVLRHRSEERLST